MNEALYRWTFNFHKVVRQQNSGTVEDFILLYSAVYLRIQKWKIIEIGPHLPKLS